ncbi:uncharacterized protein SAPINGB_P004134 [Magnusiomyces paraingens]|uniref:Cytochrome c oxidase-assembly factor COX23, mitochondrial n=1 Tax=Magnusiomyces paraingens TaxID=2606893 RepID=A0A5E8C0D1_9ASCO|nr:uncharacterized protein SAPINGB_P004134 [Saprochaete ingens]VVT54555.1 unnamed protein product [Saprochaete ingens]
MSESEKKPEIKSEATVPAKSSNYVPDVGIDNKNKAAKDLKFFPDNPTHYSHKATFTTKEPSQYYDPCQQASQMSLGCLERNNYDKEACIEYFKAYKECRQEWMDQRKRDRRSGFKW